MRSIFTILALLISVGVYAGPAMPKPDSLAVQPSAAPSGADKPMTKAEHMPQFQGGDARKFRKWVQENVVLPETVSDSIPVRTIVTFVVERDGSVSNVKKVYGPDELFADAVVATVKSSPKWTPGVHGNEIVRVIYKMPVDSREPVDDREEALMSAEKMPQFGKGGGLDEFRQWVMRQVTYPQEALKKGIEGRVLITFVIERDGKVSQVKVIQSPDDMLTAAAVRAVQRSPKWIPGEQYGRIVRVKYTLPVDFCIP